VQSIVEIGNSFIKKLVDWHSSSNVGRFGSQLTITFCTIKQWVNSQCHKHIIWKSL